MDGIQSPVIDRTVLGSGGPILFGLNTSEDTTVMWDYLYDGDFIANDAGHDHRLTVTVGDTVQTVDFYVNWLTNILVDRVSLTSYRLLDDGTLIELDTLLLPDTVLQGCLGTYYSRNTVCSFGPQFCNVSPELTDKWYRFTPINLDEIAQSPDGKQSYDLIGGNMYIIGRVDIIVDGDNLQVKYYYRNNRVWDYDQFLTFFADYDSITTVNPDEIEEKFEFGKTYSIEKDLGGDKEVILFICNEATFNDANPAISRFWPDHPRYKVQYEEMLAMIGK